MIYVTIIEDDDDIRDSLAILINGTSGFRCTKNYRDCETALPKIFHTPPDVILMDLGLPGMSGIEGIRRIKSKQPNQNILVLTVHRDSHLVFEALCAGASGYLTKDTEPVKLLNAIEDAFNGGAPMTTHIARMVVESFKTCPHTGLTPRENEVLSNLCEGMSYKMIAHTLSISEETVRRHIKNIYKKIEVTSKSEAVAKAIRKKFVHSPFPRKLNEM